LELKHRANAIKEMRPMTSNEDQFAALTRQSQEAMTNLIRTWTESIQGSVRSLAGGQRGLPDVQAMVDSVFDFAEQLLASQRAFVKNLAAASAQAAQAVTDQTTQAAESVTAGAAKAGEASAGSATQIGRLAAEETAGTTRAARNNASR
jgi:hypothetical protein